MINNSNNSRDNGEIEQEYEEYLRLAKEESGKDLETSGNNSNVLENDNLVLSFDFTQNTKYCEQELMERMAKAFLMLLEREQSEWKLLKQIQQMQAKTKGNIRGNQKEQDQKKQKEKEKEVKNIENIDGLLNKY